MTTLRQLQKEYKRLIDAYCSSREAAREALEIVFKQESNPPFIYMDCEGFASHVFYQGYVLFFCSGTIYKSVN